jgi:DNA invertase Pin-like site-specific DNA recombinase
MTKAKTPTRAFGYIRLSKADQGDTSPKRQRDAVERMCRDRGWALGEMFEDIGVSATAKRRPAFDRMMSRLG